MCGVVTFRVPPQCRVSAELVVLHKFTPMEFTIIKSRALTLSRSPQYRAFSRAVMDEKSLSPHFAVGVGGGGGAVVTNDCIKQQGYDSHQVLQCRAFSRAVMDEKLLSPLFPMGMGGGGGTVVTNEWCISTAETVRKSLPSTLPCYPWWVGRRGGGGE